MNNLQNIYLYILESNIINFILMVWFLVFVFKKAKLGSLFEKMAQNVKNNVDFSKKEVDDILKTYKDTKAEFEKLPEIKRGIIEDAHKTGEALQKKQMEDVKNNVAKIENGTEKIIKNTNALAFDNLTDKVYASALTLAEKHIEKIADENMHRHLIENAIDKLREVTL